MSDSREVIRSIRSFIDDRQRNLGGARGGGVRRVRLPSTASSSRIISRGPPCFTKDVVLLTGPNDNKVPLQGTRLHLHQSKHIVQAVDIPKDLNAEELLERLHSLFSAKLEGSRCQILVACGHFLVLPNLEENQRLTALNLQKCIRSSSTVYLRPEKQLMDPLNAAQTASVTAAPLVDDSDDSLPELDSVFEPIVPHHSDDSNRHVMQDDDGDDNEEGDDNDGDDDEDVEIVAAVTQTIETPEQAVNAALATAVREANKHGASTSTVLQAFNSRFRLGVDTRTLDLREETEDESSKECTHIYINRYTLLASAAEELLASLEDGFDPRYTLKIHFHGEAAIDLGGPRREFLHLLLKELANACIKDRKLIRREDLVDQRYYHVLGLVFGYCIHQGGPWPALLSSFGSSGDHNDQLRCGLKMMGIFQLTEKVALVQSALLNPPRREPIKPHQFLKLFEVKFDPEGTSRRVAQNKAYTTFVAYLRQAYGGRRVNGNCTLGSILRFATGSDVEPVLGFSIQPTVEFKRIEGQFFTASSNTCSNTLYIPYHYEGPSKPNHEIYDSYDLAFMNEYFGVV